MPSVSLERKKRKREFFFFDDRKHLTVKNVQKNLRNEEGPNTAFHFAVKLLSCSNGNIIYWGLSIPNLLPYYQSLLVIASLTSLNLILIAD